MTAVLHSWPDAPDDLDQVVTGLEEGWARQPVAVIPEVKPNLVFRRRCALGVSEWRVMRPHRDVGFWECSMVRWVSDVPRFRHGFVGNINVLSRVDIVAAALSGDEGWPIGVPGCICPVFRHITGEAE